MNFFAQAANAGELGSWMICAASALVILNSGMKFLDRFKGKPPAEQLQLGNDILEKRADRIEQSVDRINHEQDDRRRVIYAEIGKLRDEVTATITQLSREVSGLQTTADLTNQRLVQLDSKLDRLVERKH